VAAVVVPIVFVAADMDEPAPVEASDASAVALQGPVAAWDAVAAGVGLSPLIPLSYPGRFPSGFGQAQ